MCSSDLFTLFKDLMNTIWSDFARMIYNVEVQIEGENGQADALQPSGSGPAAATLQYTGGTMDDQPSAYDDEEYAEGAGEVLPVVQQRRVDEHAQLGRNDPCWCGSGKKFKKCHGA